MNLQLSRLRSSLMIPVAFASIVDCAIADEKEFFAELPIVASVSRLPQVISEVPAAVTVIDREMIRASGMRNVADLLRLVPGFQVTSANQDPAVVAYHGLNGGLTAEEYTPRVQVLVDGRSQYSPLFKSGVNWNLLPVALEDIERIEVIRGANTVAYGSNAFLGVINIITQTAFQAQGWLVSTNRGNNRIGDETLRWGGKVGAANVRATYQQSGDHGFQRAFYTSWTDPHDDRKGRLFDVKASLALGLRDELQMSFSYVADVSQFGRADRPTRDPLRDLRQDSTHLGAAWQRTISAEEEIKLRYGFTEDWAKGPYLEDASIVLSTLPESAPKIPVTYAADPGGRSRVHELEFEHLLSPSKETRLMWGVAAKSIALYSPGQFSTTAWKHRSNARLFGNLELRPAPAWLFNFGASLERDSLSGTMFDPRASVSFHLTDEQTLRAVVSRAHRSPSLYEAIGRIEKKNTGTTYPINLTYLGQGVEPERIDSVEVGYLGEFKAVRASFEARVFRERIPNRIQIVPLALPASSPDDDEHAGARFYCVDPRQCLNTPYPYGRADGAINLERVLMRGVEAQMRWQPASGTRLIYSNALISIDADLTDPAVIADTVGENTDKISRQTRESAPRRSQSAMVMQKLPYDIQASLLYFRSSPLRWRRNGANPVQASERFDARLAKSFRIGPAKAELAYTVQMANEAQEGRISGLRYADRLHWLSFQVGF